MNDGVPSSPAPAGPGARALRELGVLAFFLLAAVAATWPLAVTLDAATSVRPDYCSNVWNAWWVRTAVFEQRVSPYWTDWLHWPQGVELGRHTLSPLNSGAGALLGYFVGPHAAFDLVLLAHFWLSGWTFSLLARRLTGSLGAGLVGGVLWSLCPFHFYYLAQLNVATLEVLPLALLFVLRAHERGRARDVLLAALFSAVLAASALYYVAYLLLLAGLLAVAGRLSHPALPFAVGARRVLATGALCALAAVAVAWPLVSAVLRDSAAGAAVEDVVQEGRANDLLGYNWFGPPERVRVSWPTMLGWSTLLLLALGWRSVLRQRFWLLVLAVFFVLGLGASLSVGGRELGLPLPYALLDDLPGLSMLRKSDRSTVMVQLAVALLAAAAWRGLAARAAPGRRRLALAGFVLLLGVELRAAPLARLDFPVSPWFRAVARDPEVRTLVELPALPGVYYIEGRYDLHQVFHGKKIPQGYVTSLALTDAHKERTRLWQAASEALARGDGGPVAALVDELGLDRVVLNKTFPVRRHPSELDGRTIWAPFALVGGELVRARQLGGYVERPLATPTIEGYARALEERLGAPLHEDRGVVVFRGARR